MKKCLRAGTPYPYFSQIKDKVRLWSSGESSASSFSWLDIINDNLRVICLAHLSINNNTPG
jgi:hypothetical protein